MVYSRVIFFPPQSGQDQMVNVRDVELTLAEPDIWNICLPRHLQYILMSQFRGECIFLLLVISYSQFFWWEKYQLANQEVLVHH